MKNFKVLILLTLFAFPFISHAHNHQSQNSHNFYIEPLFGVGLIQTYEVDNVGETSSDKGTSDCDIDRGSSFNKGLRLGYRYQNWFGGIQFNRSFSTSADLEQRAIDKDNNLDTTGATKIDTRRTDIGIFLGRHFMNRYSLWLGYMFDSKLKATNSGTLELELPGGAVDVKYDKGTMIEGKTFLLGAGWRAHRYLQVNLEIMLSSIDENNYFIDAYNTAITDAFPMLENAKQTSHSGTMRQILLSVSVPYDFFSF